MLLLPNLGPAYTYTADGKLATRTWAREINSTPLVTSYSYDTLGQLAGITYSDGTASVSNTYDRLGRQKTVSVAGVGDPGSSSAVSFTYSPTTLALTNETVIANGTTNRIARTQDSLGRATGFTVAGVGDPGSPYTATYSHDTYGRFAGLQSSVSGLQSNVFAYTYLPGTDLISGLTQSGTGVPPVETTRHYETHRDLITAIDNDVDSTLVSGYAYANDALGRRTSVVNEGTAFAEMGDAMNLYGYNARSEVTNAVRHWGTDTGNPGDPVAGQSFGYQYDPIGNRTWSKRGDYSQTYAANALNQITSRGVPSIAHLLGSADTNATVTVNGQSVTRQDTYWYKDLTVTNSSAPAYEQVVIDATWSNLLDSVTGNVFVAKTPESFTHDDDGNLLSDGRFTYEWDGENRLAAIETASTAITAGAPRVRIQYNYDSMSRRISKTSLSTYTNGSYSATNSTAYLYDGWNLIAEKSTLHSLGGGGLISATNFYTWGLDLSGSLQGAGGIGGLLQATKNEEQGTNNYFFTYDANGNVGQLLDTASPTNILAHYEYSPFGETIVAVGDLAQDNLFRFSTKYYEKESGLVYYGYRYLHPETGRWISRDPIGESSFNLYSFIANYSGGDADILGMTGWSWSGVTYSQDGYTRFKTATREIEDESTYSEVSERFQSYTREWNAAECKCYGIKVYNDRHKYRYRWYHMEYQFGRSEMGERWNVVFDTVETVSDGSTVYGLVRAVTAANPATALILVYAEDAVVSAVQVSARRIDGLWQDWEYTLGTPGDRYQNNCVAGVCLGERIDLPDRTVRTHIGYIFSEALCN